MPELSNDEAHEILNATRDRLGAGALTADAANQLALDLEPALESLWPAPAEPEPPAALTAGEVAAFRAWQAQQQEKGNAETPTADA